MCPPRKLRLDCMLLKELYSREPKNCAGHKPKMIPELYRIWQKLDPGGEAAEKYLVDDSGAAVWLVDPGINGTHKTRPDGAPVRKFDAPKAVLMSYIIKGILDRKLPWGLVLFGVMSSIVLELCAFRRWLSAVGVYLPIY